MSAADTVTSQLGSWTSFLISSFQLIICSATQLVAQSSSAMEVDAKFKEKSVQGLVPGLQGAASRDSFQGGGAVEVHGGHGV